MTPSKKKSRAILEAITLWGSCRTLSFNGDYDKPSPAYISFSEKLSAAGWKRVAGFADGSFKQSYTKNNIVVKFPKFSESYSGGEIRREYEQWLCAPNKFRIYLPKTYCMLDSVLIQDRVLNSCDEFRKHGKACYIKSLGDQFKLADYVHNHGHSKRGEVKFFDWVYNRTYDHLNDPKKGLYA